MSDSLGLPSLGNLAQSAREKHLKSAKRVLIICGILTVLWNGVELANTKSIVDNAIEEQVKPIRAKGQVADPKSIEMARERMIRFIFLLDGTAVLLGVIFIVCGMAVYRYPVPATVLSLVLYLGAIAIFGVLVPATLVMGWLGKIIVLACLVKGVQAAFAYQSERNAAAEGAMLPLCRSLQRESLAA